MPKRYKTLKITAVGLVDAGANQLSHIRMWKRAPTPEGAMPDAELRKDLDQTNTEVDAAIAKWRNANAELRATTAAALAGPPSLDTEAGDVHKALLSGALPSFATVNAELLRLFERERAVVGLRPSDESIWSQVFNARVDPRTKINPNAYAPDDWRRRSWGEAFEMAFEAEADGGVRKAAADEYDAATTAFEEKVAAVRAKHPDWGLVKARDAFLRTAEGRAAWKRQHDAGLNANESRGQ